MKMALKLTILILKFAVIRSLAGKILFYEERPRHDDLSKLCPFSLRESTPQSNFGCKGIENWVQTVRLWLK